MAERNSDIIWKDSRELRQNQSRNEKPFLANVEIEDSSLIPIRRKGVGLYVYDFGGVGTIGNLEWEGDGFVSFRYKVANTKDELNEIDFEESYSDHFKGDELNTSQWSALPGPYVIVQNDQLDIRGATDDFTSIFQQQAILEAQETKEFPGALLARMKLFKLGNASGGKVFLGISDGTNSIVLQKIYEKLKASSPQVGRAVNTNIGNVAVLVVTRNGTLIFQDRNAKKLTEGVLEGIDYQDIPTVAIDTLINLKRYASVPTVDGNPRPYGITAEAIPFRVRADYNPTQSVTDFRQYLHYDITRDVGFYRATVPIINRRIDLYESQIKSFNWNPETRLYEEADTDNIWKIALTLPPGIYRYNFWLDGRETVDVTNPKSYYLDQNNNKISVFKQTGYGYGYGEEIVIPEGAIFFSELILEETQTVEFVYQGYAKQTSLIGSFNSYDPKRHLMRQQVDRQLIRRLADPNFIYVNSNEDYHKIEIILPYRMSIDTIDFVTLIPKDHKQRVKIYLDDIPVTRLDWNLIPGVLELTDTIQGEGTGQPIPISMVYGYGYGVPITGYGVSYGYGSGYGIDYGYGAGTGYGTSAVGYGSGLKNECILAEGASCNEIAAQFGTFSYWDNNTDTITASEDEVVRWCLKDGLVRTAQKLTFLSRIEASISKTRKHVSLDFYGTIDQAHTVSDYAFSDAYAFVQQTHTTFASPLQQWQLPIINLLNGSNELIPSTLDSNGNPVYGDPITVDVLNTKPSVWELNRSEWAGHTLEVIYGIAGQLRAPPLKMFSIIDDRSLNISPIQQPNERFVDLRFKKTVELVNVQVTPKTELVVALIGTYNTFQLRFYDTMEEAKNDRNRLGTIRAIEYGEMFPADFVGIPSGTEPNFFKINKTVPVFGIETQVIVGNIIATYERGGGDKYIKIGQVR